MNMANLNWDQLGQLMSGFGSNMAAASYDPNRVPTFAEAMGAGAKGMMQGQQAYLQNAQQQAVLDQMEEERRQKQEWAKTLAKILGDEGGGGGGGFMSELAASPAPVAALGGTAPGMMPGKAQASPLAAYPEVGALSRQFESGAGGVGTVSSGAGDAGGVSYGTHQLASNTGTMADFLSSQEGQPFAESFEGLTPGSEGFTQQYKILANSPAGQEMERAQMQYLDRTHIKPTVNYAQQQGVDVSDPAIYEALISSSIQHSGKGNREILDRVESRLGDNADPEAFLRTFYDERGKYASQFASPAATTERYAKELDQALGLLGATGATGATAPATGGATAGATAATPAAAGMAAMMQPGATGPGATGGGGLFAGLPPQQAEALKLILPNMPMNQQMQILGQLATQRPASSTLKPTAEMQNALFAAGGDPERARQLMIQESYTQSAPKPSAKDQQVQALMEHLGWSHEDAIARVYGGTELDQLGNLRDMRTGEILTERLLPEAPEQTLIPEDLDLTKATGARSVVDDIVNKARDVAGLPLTERGEEVEQGVRILTNLGNTTQVALSSAVSGRPSNYLMERIDAIIAHPTEFWTGDSRALATSRALLDTIRSEKAMAETILTSPEGSSQASLDQAKRSYLLSSQLENQWSAVVDSFERNMQGGEAGNEASGQSTANTPWSQDNPYQLTGTDQQAMEAEARALPPGSFFIGPDGQVWQTQGAP